MPTLHTTLLTTAQAAAAVGLSSSSLEKMRVRGDGPTYILIGRRRVAYTPEALFDWVHSRQHRSTKEYAA